MEFVKSVVCVQDQIRVLFAILVNVMQMLIASLETMADYSVCVGLTLKAMASLAHVSFMNTGTSLDVAYTKSWNH